MGQISVGSLQVCLVGCWSAVCWRVFGGVGGRASHCLSFIKGWGGLGLVLVGLDQWQLVHCWCCCSGLSGDCGGGMVSIFSSFTHGLLVFCSGMCVSCRCVITVVGVCLFLKRMMISHGIAFAWPLLARGKKCAWWWLRFEEPPPSTGGFA